MNDILNAPYALTLPDPSDLLLIVGEPGMGKTYAAREFLRRQHGAAKVELVLCNNKPNNLQTKVERLRNKANSQLRKRGQGSIAALVDGFPVVEEDLLAEVASVLRELNRLGCVVVVTLRPEAEELLEHLSEGRVVRGSDLLCRLPSTPSESAVNLHHLTNGIPLLVGGFDAEDQPSAHFYKCLSTLVEQSLRSGIPQAEREVRAAMMLLGRGTLAELEEIIPSADDETIAWLESEAPLFGIRTFGGTFACAALADDAALKACHATLRRLPDVFTEAECRVVDLLLARRDYVRAGICCSIIAPSDRRARVALRQGAELALSGAALVVADAVREAMLLGMQEEPGFVTSRAMLQILEEPYEAALFAHARLGVGWHQLGYSVARTHVDLVMAARSLDAGRHFQLASHDAHDTLSEVLLEHVMARGLLLEGRPSAAVERLSMRVLTSTPATVADALLLADVLIANTLCTRLRQHEELEWTEGSCALLEGSRLHRLAGYARALRDVLAVLAGGTSTPATSRAIHQAGQAEDWALCAILLIVEAVSDLRRAAPAKAHVCLARAASLAVGPAFGRIREWALLLDALALTSMGEEGAIVRLLGDELEEGVAKDVVRLLVMAQCDLAAEPVSAEPEHGGAAAGTPAASDLATLSLMRVDRDALWLICIVASDFGSLSAQFRRSLPPVWLHALSYYGEQHAEEAGASRGAPTRGVASKPSAATQQGRGPVESEPGVCVERAKPVSISLLGGLRVAVNGRLIAPTRVGRRRANLLLALLATHEGHVMRRTELVDDIWGAEVLEVGLQRLYEATSTARSVLGAREQGFDPFVSRRGKEMIALDPDVITFDIDELERVAYACVSRDVRDEDVVSDACRARELYVGDLDTKTLPDLPWVRHRRDLLCDQFVDAMVAGARSALRLGRIRVALALARSGFAHGDLREDVMTVYVRSLVAVGRPGEARTLFESFSFRVTRATGVPPSNDLRRLVAELCPVGHESGPGTKVFDGGIGLDDDAGAEGGVGGEARAESGAGASAATEATLESGTRAATKANAEPEANANSIPDTGPATAEGDTGEGGEFDDLTAAAA